MAKRQRRKTSANPPMKYPQMETAPKASSSVRSTSEFNPDYSAVKKDLKRIGVLAGSFFVILIALSFILR